MVILLLGGSGYIGTALSAHFRAQGQQIIILSRSATSPLTLPVAPSSEAIGRYPQDLHAATEAADAVINLTGVSVIATRWSKAGKLAILNSRVEPALAAVHALLRLGPDKPRSYVQASGISAYSDGFLAHVCRSWEAPAEGLAERAMHGRLPIRTAIVRIGMVLGPGSGAEQQLETMARRKLVGGLASNSRWQSPIAIGDLCRMFAWILATDTAEGVYNGVAPHPIRMAELYPPLRAAFGWQIPFDPPAALIKLAMGAKAELALTPLRIMPSRALAEGFTFAEPRPQLSFTAKT